MCWNFVTRVYIAIHQGVLLDLAGHRYGDFKKRSATTGLQLFRFAVDFPMHDLDLTIDYLPVHYASLCVDHPRDSAAIPAVLALIEKNDLRNLIRQLKHKLVLGIRISY